MKVTIINAAIHEDLQRAAYLVARYQAAGFADGQRPATRHCVAYTRAGDRTAAVWGGPEHIRVRFMDAETEMPSP